MARDDSELRSSGGEAGSRRIGIAKSPAPPQARRDECEEARMGWFRTLALAAVAAAALTGAAAAQVTYNRGNDADPETLDPHKTSTVYEANILRDLYEGLLIHDGAGKVAPGVAEKHEISDDGTRLPLHAPEQREMVERRPGEGVRLRLLLPPHHGPEHRREIRQHPLSDPQRREGQQGPAGREARGPRRQGGRRPHGRDHARAPDALLPRAPDPSERHARASGHHREASARTSPSPRTWSRTAPMC